MNIVFVRHDNEPVPAGQGTLVQDYSSLSRIDTLVTRNLVIHTN